MMLENVDFRPQQSDEKTRPQGGIFNSPGVKPTAIMPAPFVHTRRVLFGECDPGGILYTPRAADYVVEAGLAFMREKLGGQPERQLFEMGIAPPARELSIEFVQPMSWDDELEIAVEPVELRTRAIVLQFSGRVDGDAVLEAGLTLVCISTESMEPVPIPDRLREALQPGTGD